MSDQPFPLTHPDILPEEPDTSSSLWERERILSEHERVEEAVTKRTKTILGAIEGYLIIEVQSSDRATEADDTVAAAEHLYRAALVTDLLDVLKRVFLAEGDKS